MRALSIAAAAGFVESTRVQELSLGMSNACREGSAWVLLVDEDTPWWLTEHLWPDSGGATGSGPEAMSEAPEGLPPALLLLQLPPPVAGRRARLCPRRLITRVRLEVDRGVTLAVWPLAVTRLEFGSRFNQPVEGMVLPDDLVALSFGARFNQVGVRRGDLSAPSFGRLLVVKGWLECVR